MGNAHGLAWLIGEGNGGRVGGNGIDMRCYTIFYFVYTIYIYFRFGCKLNLLFLEDLLFRRFILEDGHSTHHRLTS